MMKTPDCVDVQPVSSIFIAYRQSDAKAWAIVLRDAMAHAFGDDAVFMDQDSLHAGPWPEQLRLAVQHSKVVLVVIGRHWLDTTDPEGRRRLWLTDDVHRQEIASALSQSGVTVLPVCVDGAAMPQASELPAELSTLAAMQSHPLGDAHRRRQADMATIIRSVAALTGLQPAGDHIAAANGTGLWRILASTLLLTGVAATFFSRASMRLDLAELLVLLVIAFAVSLSGRTLWRWLTRSRHGG